MATRLEKQSNKIRMVFGSTLRASRKSNNNDIPERLKAESKESLVRDLKIAVAEAESGRLNDSDKAFKIIENALTK